MTKNQVVSLAEQLDFVDSLVSVFEALAAAVAGVEAAEAVIGAKADLEKMLAVRETIHFDYLLSEIAAAEDIPWLEETTIC